MQSGCPEASGRFWPVRYKGVGAPRRFCAPPMRLDAQFLRLPQVDELGRQTQAPHDFMKQRRQDLEAAPSGDRRVPHIARRGGAAARQALGRSHVARQMRHSAAQPHPGARIQDGGGAQQDGRCRRRHQGGDPPGRAGGRSREHLQDSSRSKADLQFVTNHPSEVADLRAKMEDLLGRVNDTDVRIAANDARQRHCQAARRHQHQPRDGGRAAGSGRSRGREDRPARLHGGGRRRTRCARCSGSGKWPSASNRASSRCAPAAAAARSPVREK